MFSRRLTSAFSAPGRLLSALTQAEVEQDPLAKRLGGGLSGRSLLYASAMTTATMPVISVIQPP